MKKKIEVGDIVQDGPETHTIQTKRFAEILNKPRMSLIKKIGITTSNLERDYILRSTFNEFKETWDKRNDIQEEKIVELIGESKALQEKREIFRFIMNNAGQNFKTKMFSVLLDESEIEELKKLCGVEE